MLLAIWIGDGFVFQGVAETAMALAIRDVFGRAKDRLLLVGSNFGRARRPAWSSNLLADPNAWVTMGGREIPVIPAQRTGPERERIFSRFADYAGNYDAYRDRDLRVFEPTDAIAPLDLSALSKDWGLGSTLPVGAGHPAE